MIDKVLFGYLSAALALASFAPYFLGLARGSAKPHIFTWLIWTLLTSIGAFAQYKSGAGPGAWAAIISAILSFSIVLFSLRRGEKTVTVGDWCYFLAALSALPLWYFTSNPLWAVVLISVIDSLAYYPTLRKSWAKPHQEPALHYFLSNMKHICSLIAIVDYSATTVLYSIAMLVMNGTLIAELLFRRATLAKITK